jgi:hypothetical protein
MAETVPYWRLIAVLFSSLPLSPPLAMRLYRAAVELHQTRDEVHRLTGDLAMGEVRRLQGTQVMGSVTGPGFEADVDTPEGKGRVRFIVTPQGLEDSSTDEEPATPGLPPVPRPRPGALPN